MADSRSAFQRMVLEQFLPQFCTHYGYDPAGFKQESIHRISEHDSAWFLEALRSQTVLYESPFFLASESGTKEQILWQGPKSASPRYISIWIEPVITIAAAGRLHHQLNWPRDLIGLQSKKNWAFDLVGYSVSRQPLLACEVKKSNREIDQLIQSMMAFLQQPPLSAEPKQPSLRNAYRKVSALRAMKPDLFWALGPENYGKIFRCSWSAPAGGVALNETGEDALRWPLARHATAKSIQGSSMLT